MTKSEEYAKTYTTKVACRAALVSLFTILLSSIFNNMDVMAEDSGKNMSGKLRMEVSSLLTKPDFAMPKDVIDNAGAALETALAHNMPVEALQSAVQLTIAQESITSDSTVMVYERLRELPERLAAPFSNVAYLLESRFLETMYANNRWNYDKRILPENEVSRDPREWSGEQFKSRIRQLNVLALQDPGKLKKVDLAEMSALVEYDGVWKLSDFTLLDFVSYRVAECNSNLGLDGDSGSILLNLSREESDRLPAGLLAHINSWGYNRSDKSALLADARSLLEEYTDSDYRSVAMAGVYLYCFQWMPENEQQEFYRNLSEMNDEGQYCKGARQSMLSQISHAEVDINIPGQILPGQEFEVRWTNRNAKKFSLLLVKLPGRFVAQVGNGSSAIEQSDIRKYGTIVQSVKVASDSSFPFEESGNSKFTAQIPGAYAVVASSTDGFEGMYGRDFDFAMAICSNITYLYDENAESGTLYILDARNGNPIPGAAVKLTKLRNYWNKEPEGTAINMISGTDGGVKVRSIDSYQVDASLGEDRMVFNVRNYFNSRMNTRNSLCADVLTDLGLYRPGQNVEFVCVVTRTLKNLPMACGGEALKATLRNANGEKSGQLDLITDNTGRATGKFKIPEGVMTGTFEIEVNDCHGVRIGYETFQVAEYKAPTFKVTLNSPKIAGDSIIFTGSVITYSGVPLAGSEVNVKVSYNPWWFASVSPGSYNVNAVTDCNGEFKAALNISDIKKESGQGGMFTATANATSASGESQSSEMVRVATEERYTVTSTAPSSIKVTGASVELPVRVTDASGKPACLPLEYTIEGVYLSKVRLSGQCMPGIISVPSGNLPSGTYLFEARIDRAACGDTLGITRDNQLDSLRMKIVVWREADKIPASETTVWAPLKKIYASKGADMVRIPVGSSYNGSLFVKISSTDGESEAEWRRFSGDVDQLTVEAPITGERKRVEVFGVHNLDNCMERIDIYPASEKVRVKVVPTTFRDELKPGSQEHWQFEVTADGKALPQTAAMAVMSNAALDAIHPFSWDFNPERGVIYQYQGQLAANNVSRDYFGFNFNNTVPARMPDLFSQPEWDFYGRPLYSEYGMVTRLYKSAARSYASVSDLMMSDYADADMETAGFNSAGETGMPAPTAVEETSAEESEKTGESGKPLRDVECPLAFFQPLLLADGGVVNLDFTVPDFNTEWKLQLLAYDPLTMKFAELTETAVASKPVMVSTNVPRFLRTSDKTVVMATLLNNTEKELAVSADMELFDPVTGKVYASRRFEEERMTPASVRVVQMEFDVPQYITVVGIRSRAYSAEGNDGEQTVVPVLPATQPVYDSKTFYLDEETTKFEMNLPTISRHDKVTFEYCDNPEWYVLMSLTGTLNPQSESSLVLADALFTNAVGHHMVSANPALRAALQKYGTGDSRATESALTRNETMSMSKVSATPWVNNAAAETERMRSVVTLCDDVTVDAAVAGLSAKLGQMQVSGGWPWIKGFEPSLFITEEVLWRLSAMKALGVLDKENERMAVSAVGYCDARYAETYRRAISATGKYEPGYGDMEYLYIRGRFDVGMPEEIAAIRELTINRILSDWKNMDVASKSFAAMILNRNGRRSTAEEILESLDQFASRTPEKGMWFDGATGALSQTSPVMTAAMALKAYSELRPGSPEVSGLRQYLLLSRQTQDWNLGMSDAKAVVVASAVLETSSGHRNDMSNQAVVRIGDMKIDVNKAASVPGSLTIELDPEKASGRRLVIDRRAGVPAWGGMLCQYESPMSEIKARRMEQLGITRELYPVITDSLQSKVGKSTTSFKRGDRIRVTLTITADRDLDYLMVSDWRAACEEPVGQLTQYVSEDGIVYVRENLNSQTNLYIHNMPKGIRVISYEVTADRDGSYSAGTAIAQSLYYPLITARSGALRINVGN